MRAAHDQGRRHAQRGDAIAGRGRRYRPQRAERQQIGRIGGQCAGDDRRHPLRHAADVVDREARRVFTARDREARARRHIGRLGLDARGCQQRQEVFHGQVVEERDEFGARGDAKLLLQPVQHGRLRPLRIVGILEVVAPALRALLAHRGRVDGGPGVRHSRGVRHSHAFCHGHCLCQRRRVIRDERHGQRVPACRPQGQLTCRQQAPTRHRRNPAGGAEVALIERGHQRRHLAAAIDQTQNRLCQDGIAVAKADAFGRRVHVIPLHQPDEPRLQVRIGGRALLVGRAVGKDLAQRIVLVARRLQRGIGIDRARAFQHQRAHSLGVAVGDQARHHGAKVIAHQVDLLDLKHAQQVGNVGHHLVDRIAGRVDAFLDKPVIAVGQRLGQRLLVGAIRQLRTGQRRLRQARPARVHDDDVARLTNGRRRKPALHLERALAGRTSQDEHRVGQRFLQARHGDGEDADGAAAGAGAILRHGQEAAGHDTVNLHVDRAGDRFEGRLIVDRDDGRRRLRRNRCRDKFGDHGRRHHVGREGRFRQRCAGRGHHARIDDRRRRRTRLDARHDDGIGQPFEPVEGYTHQFGGPIVGARQHAQHAVLRRQGENDRRGIGVAVDFGDRHCGLPRHILPRAVAQRWRPAVQRIALQRGAEVGKEGERHVLPAGATRQHRFVGARRPAGRDRRNGEIRAKGQCVALGDDLRKGGEAAPALTQRRVAGRGEQGSLRRRAQIHGQRLGQRSGRIVGEGHHDTGGRRRPETGAHVRRRPVEHIVDQQHAAVGVEVERAVETAAVSANGPAFVHACGRLALGKQRGRANQEGRRQQRNDDGKQQEAEL